MWVGGDKMPNVHRQWNTLGTNSTTMNSTKQIFVLNISKGSQKNSDRCWTFPHCTAKARAKKSVIFSKLWIKITEFIRLRCDRQILKFFAWAPIGTTGLQFSFCTHKTVFLLFRGAAATLSPLPLATPTINSHRFALLID